MKRPIVVDSFWRRSQFALLPPYCLLCGLHGASARDLCNDCAADFVRNDQCCERCALPMPQSAPLCGECLRREPPFDGAYAPFLYRHPLDLLMTKFKFGHSLAAGRVLAELWIAAIESSAIPIPEMLIAVPLHSTRLRERGFNQAHELAKPIAMKLQIRAAADVLRRNRSTPAQIDLPADVRRRNLKNAFSVSVGALPAHVALIDDVMTTGATVRECARTLKRFGVARVDVWAFARAAAPR